MVWTAHARPALLAWAATCAADPAAGRWEALDAAALLRLAQDEAHQPGADPAYLSRLVGRSARAATHRPLTMAHWQAWGLEEVVLGGKKSGKTASQIAEVIQHIREQRQRLATEQANETLTAALMALAPGREQ